MKDRLAVISSRNPSEILLKTIDGLKEYYNDFDIVIIDSNSDNMEMYKKLSEDCIVEKIGNNNYELGAWKYAFEKYNNYKVYMFIQDTLTPLCRIPDLEYDDYKNGTIYTFDYYNALHEGGYLDHLFKVYENTDLHFISELDPHMRIRGGAHTSFILDKEHIPIMLQLENAYIQKNIKKYKHDSWLSERTCGIMADKMMNRINIGMYFLKTNGHRY